MIEEAKDKLIKAEKLLEEVVSMTEVTSTMFRHLQDIRLKLNGILGMGFGVSIDKEK